MSDFIKLPLEIISHIAEFLGTPDTFNLLSTLRGCIDIDDIIQVLYTSKRRQRFGPHTEDKHLEFLMEHSSSCSSSVLDFSNCRLLSYACLSTYINFTHALSELCLRNCLSSTDFCELQLPSQLHKMDVSFNNISIRHFKSFLSRNEENVKDLCHLSLAGCGERYQKTGSDEEVRIFCHIYFSLVVVVCLFFL